MEKIVDLSNSLFALLQTEEERKKFLKLNSRSIRLLNKSLRSGVFNHGEKLKCEASLAKLKGLGEKAKRRRQHSGTGLSQDKLPKKRSERVHWQEMNSAFRSRIRTAAILNLIHKFPEEFLDDALCLLETRIKNIIKSNGVIKINVGLVCTYELERTGEIEDKHFTTQNFQITETTELPEILKQMKETLLKRVSFFIILRRVSFL